MRVFGWIAGIVAVIALVIYGSFALYEGSWSLAQSQANHEAHLQQHGFEYQSTVARQMTKDIALVFTDKEQLDNMQKGTQSYTDQRARMASDAGDVCQDASQVTDVDEVGKSNFDFAQANCSAGVLKPTSVYSLNNQ